VKITSLSIKNFRGISQLETGTLGDTIIVAGQNGSGKSCIFDAIRLLKSVYGGYQQNEWQHFFCGISNSAARRVQKSQRSF
jgi:AAA15 family ATPase/GTPase